MPIIVEDQCKGCRLCIPYCPVDAFQVVSKKKVAIDQDRCVECYVCLRKEVCPSGAIVPTESGGYPAQLQPLPERSHGDHRLHRGPRARDRGV